jgi:phytoene dehydrogenase-like protein
LRNRSTEYDAVIIGSGPNGLAAAITLQAAGLSVLVIEGKSTIGGGTRTEELTLPGFRHDVCSAIHPMAAASPFLQSLPLHEHGLEYIVPEVAAAHPFDDGTAAVLHRSMSRTADELKEDGKIYLQLFGPLVRVWDDIVSDILAPLRVPKHPVPFAQFGIKALSAASSFARRFETREARALWAGMAAHSAQPLTNLSTSAVALVLMTAGHKFGWPIPIGGSASITTAMASYFKKRGGKIECGRMVTSLSELPSSAAILFDTAPKQLLQIAGHSLSNIYKWQLQRFRYGCGVYKIDWALADKIPFKAPVCGEAATVHIGNTIEEITAYESAVSQGRHPDTPFVLLAQQSVFDESRAPKGKHTGWGYCHVPNGSNRDMTDIIEKQIERFAPGFRERILARHVINSADMELYNPNYVGGDIAGGAMSLDQLFTRPALRWSPYRTSTKGMYLCSSSTPPGGGVHGMCGYHAARKALTDVFRLPIPQFSNK